MTLPPRLRRHKLFGMIVDKLSTGQMTLVELYEAFKIDCPFHTPVDNHLFELVAEGVVEQIGPDGFDAVFRIKGVQMQCDYGE